MTVELVGKGLRSAVAGEAMTDKKHYIVQLDATGKIEVAEGATDLVVGVLQDNCAAGEPATYAFAGTVKVKAGGVVAIGDFVTTNNAGKAIATTTDGDVVIGRYVGTAAAADGDLIEVQMGIHRFFIA